LAAELKAEVVTTAEPGHATFLARAAAGRYDPVVVVGGDGLVNEALNGLLTSPVPDTTLAILPAGTGNDLARSVGILTWEDGVRALQGGRVWAIDVIAVTCGRGGREITHYAGLGSGVGFGARVIQSTQEWVKRLFGPQWCYSVGVFRALLSYRSPWMRVIYDGGQASGRIFFLSVGNAEYESGGTMRVSPGAKMDDGLLNVNLIYDGPRWEVVLNYPRFLRGTHITHHRVRYFTTTALTVVTEPLVALQLDGDVRGCTPAHFQVRPRALHLQVPESRNTNQVDLPIM